jgi:phospholipase A1
VCLAYSSELRLWARISENPATDENPDYTDYSGSMEVKFSYFVNKHMFILMQRGSVFTGRGATEITYSYPLDNDVYLYELHNF